MVLDSDLDLLTLEEVAEILKLDYQTVWKMSREQYVLTEVLPTVRVGRMKRVRRVALAAWLEGQQTFERRDFAIMNRSGQFWTAHGCWGQQQAADKYRSLVELPESVDGLDKVIHATPKQGGVLDIRYYRGNAEDSEARVVELGA